VLERRTISRPGLINSLTPTARLQRFRRPQHHSMANYLLRHADSNDGG
jgi:hypothetical protein